VDFGEQSTPTFPSTFAFPLPPGTCYQIEVDQKGKKAKFQDSSFDEKEKEKESGGETRTFRGGPTLFEQGSQTIHCVADFASH
jgi:hypothetical protein